MSSRRIENTGSSSPEQQRLILLSAGLRGLLVVPRHELAQVARALHPVGVQTMRAGGSSPRLTAASTGLRPCVRSAWRVASATTPPSRRFRASRVTSTRVHTSRPSEVDLTDHDAQTSFFSGVTRFDSLTLQFSVIRGAPFYAWLRLVGGR